MDGANIQGIAAMVQANLRSVFASHRCIPPVVKVVFQPPERNPGSLKLIRVHRAFELGPLEVEAR